MDQLFYLFLSFVVGLLLGGGIMWLVHRTHKTQLSEQLSAAEQNLQKLVKEHEELLLLKEQLTEKKQGLCSEITKLTTTLELERLQTKEKLDFKEITEKQLTDKFKLLADEILEEKK